MTNEQTEAREALAGFDLHMQAGVPSHVILGEYESEQIVGSMRERGWRPPLPAPSEGCIWFVDDGDGLVRTERRPHDFTGDGATCINCLASRPTPPEDSTDERTKP